MTRWFSKRWAWAAAVGATMTVSLAAVGADAPPQKVGATISLTIEGKGERQFKVLKCEKQADGSYHSELKDTKSGETITLVDQPDAAPAKGAGAPEPGKPVEPPKAPDAAPPKAKPRANDPLTPPLAATMPDAAKDKEKDKEKEKDKRPILGRVFGDRDKSPEPNEPAKKPGLFGRVFGPKKPPAASAPAMTAPAGAKPTSATPPAVIPTPAGGLTGGSTTAEPPRVMPTRPVTPPPVTTAPSVPAPAPATTTPSIPAPLPTVPSIPAPLPSAPATTAPPAIPVPLPAAPGGGSGLPPIPVPPGGTSSTKPLQIVVPAGYVPPQVAFDRDVEPFVIALQSMDAPSARLTAAKGLAEGRHGSTDGVKAVLFKAAQADPCGEVRAACVTHLCKLGYFDPQFLGYIQTACGDPDQHVSAAAKAACAKLLRK
ncbi:hypothetical protein R5W24_006086 [Gemmata sp. JC717]|uniref:hypothetical protein n=1 Tax=Gemmata algarum TaxID=2975278 RepID=UPI0021BA7201|nr:hypothetical protein [Gemmata algarum]MDY3556912.1 hypothetical protein [Gemmata algarum]